MVLSFHVVPNSSLTAMRRQLSLEWRSALQSLTQTQTPAKAPAAHENITQENNKNKQEALAIQTVD